MNYDGSIYFLPSTVRAPRKGIECLVAGLTVIKMPGRGHYRRVGMFYVNVKSTLSRDSPRLQLFQHLDEDMYESLADPTDQGQQQYVLSNIEAILGIW